MTQATSFWRRFFHYLHNGFVLSNTVLFIFGLVLSHALVEKTVVDVLIDFLTDDVHLSLRKAIVLTNMLNLVSAVFKFGVTHISEAYTGPFSVIIFCTAAYTMGLMLLWLRTWLILAIVLIALGKAGEEPSLRDFFNYQLSEKLREKCTQNNKREYNKESSEENNCSGNSNNLWSSTASFTGACTAIFWLGTKDDWPEKFKVSSLVMGSAYLLFFCGIFCYYPNVRSIGSPLTTIYRVLMAAIQNRRLPYPSSKEGYYSRDNTHQGSNESENLRPKGIPLIATIHRVLFKAAIEKRRILAYPSKEGLSLDESKEQIPTQNPISTIYGVLKAAIKNLRLPNPFSVEGHNEGSNNDMEDPFYRRENGEVHVLPRDASFYFLLFLDKAAIIRNNDKFDDAEGKEKYEEFCTAEQVRDVKSLYLLIPLAFIFFAYSLTFASGNTYFVMQTQNLNPKVGGFHVPIMVFFVLQSLVAFAVRTVRPIRKLVKPSWSIAVGMFCSVLCCIAASLVEQRRLHLINPFKDDSDATIPLNIMVLTPQYFLLGLMQGFAEYGLEGFLCMVLPESMIKFVEPCIQVLLVIGNFSSVLFVFIFHSWIKDSINNSHLEKYFLMLASLSFVFFGIYVCCVKFKLLKLAQFDGTSETNQVATGKMDDLLEVLADSINS